MKKRLKGRAWRFGDHIHGDRACQYSKSRFVPLEDKKALAKICMTGYDPDFHKKARSGDFIVGGKNFGWGHIHAHFYASIKALEISAIIVKSANDRFYREAIHYGIPVLFFSKTRLIQNGEEIAIDLMKGKIFLTSGKRVDVGVLPPLLKEIIEKGSIDHYIKSKLKS